MPCKTNQNFLILPNALYFTALCHCFKHPFTSELSPVYKDANNKEVLILHVIIELLRAFFILEKTKKKQAKNKQAKNNSPLNLPHFNFHFFSISRVVLSPIYVYYHQQYDYFIIMTGVSRSVPLPLPEVLKPTNSTQCCLSKSPQVSWLNCQCTAVSGSSKNTSKHIKSIKYYFLIFNFNQSKENQLSQSAKIKMLPRCRLHLLPNNQRRSCELWVLVTHRRRLQSQFIEVFFLGKMTSSTMQIFVLGFFVCVISI